MSSSAQQGRHLDAFSGRDVVYCHNCENEWYQDDHHGLDCPRCQGGFTEIVTAENDPRNIETETRSEPARRSRRRPGIESDSDPDEDDIEEHISTGPGGVFITQRVYRNPTRRGAPGAGRSPVDPADEHGVVNRFHEMLFQDFGLDPVRRRGSDFPFPPLTHGGPGEEDHGPRFSRTTVRTSNFPGGSASFTITTAPMGADNDFNAVLHGIMGNMAPIPPFSSPGGGAGGRGSPGDPHGLPAALHHLMGALLTTGVGGAFGDAVYSQEALDRIITGLMEANPQSNAAPPASQAAIDRLERKAVDAKMMGSEGKSECTICIDELKVGDEVVVLPCNHWFHGECVILWLKEHNTCPICRHPVEDRSSPASGSRTSAPNSSSTSASASAAPSAPPSAAGTPNPAVFHPWDPLWYPGRRPQELHEPTNVYAGGSSGNNNSNIGGGSASASSSHAPSSRPLNVRTDNSAYRRRDRLFRTPSENESRLNAIRGTAAAFSPTTPTGGQTGVGGSSRGTPPLGGYRRNSLSPPNMEPASSSHGNGGGGSSRRNPDAASQASSSGNTSSSRRAYAGSWRDRRSPSRSPPPTHASHAASLASYRRSLFGFGEQDRGEGGAGAGGGMGGNMSGAGDNGNQQLRGNLPPNNGGGGSGGAATNSSSSGSHNPLGWLRDRWTGGGSSSGNTGASGGGSGGGAGANSNNNNSRWRY